MIAKANKFQQNHAIKVLQKSNLFKIVITAHSMMIKLYGNSISKIYSIIFNDCLNKGKFCHEWKKVNVIPVHRKENKQSLKNYRPISILSICGKIF